MFRQLRSIVYLILKKKKKPDLRSIAWIIHIIEEFVKDKNKKGESLENKLRSKGKEKENNTTETS